MNHKLNLLLEESIEKGIQRVRFRRELEAVHEELAAEGAIAPARKPRIRWMWVAAAAAVVLLAIGSLWYWQNRHAGPQLYAQHFQPLSTEIVGGVKGALAGEWQTAYNQGHYAKAAERLEFCLAQQSCSPFHRVYLGVAYLALDQQAQATEQLKAAVQTPGLFIARRNVARYYLALAQLKAGAAGAARPHLQSIIASDDTNNPFFKPANTLLQELE